MSQFHSISRLIVLCALLVGTTAFAKANVPKDCGAIAPDTYHTFTHRDRSAPNGYTRGYLLNRPSGKMPAAGWQVVVVLHGGGGNACNVRNQSKTSGAVIPGGSLANGYANTKDQRFITVYPDGAADNSIYGNPRQHWNDGRIATNPINDVTFIERILSRLASDHNLHYNPKRVFVMGVSNGGMMAFRMAKDSSKIAGIGTIVANIPTNLITADNRAFGAVPSLILVGFDDALVPSDGGCVRNPLPLNTCLDPRAKGDDGMILSAQDTLRVMQSANGITELQHLRFFSSSMSERAPTVDLSGAPAVTRVDTYSSTARGLRKRVEMIRIYGAGHNWHGPQLAADDSSIKPGQVGARYATVDGTNYADATSNILDFFGRTPSLP